MSAENLNRLLSAANEFDASDLHLVVGVPPAYRVNGEIIIADEDALTEDEITAIADSLLNEQQRKKFDQEWELCISILHSVAGRVRATFYRRNNHPEMSLRFCGDKIATRAELGLPEKIDDLARKPNGLVLVTGPTGAGKTTTLNYLIDLINSERRCKIVTIEDPIEFVHENKRAIVVQQEVLTDVRSFNRALIHVNSVHANPFVLPCNLNSERSHPSKHVNNSLSLINLPCQSCMLAGETRRKIGLR
jgi:twitching motility protein PilT